MMKFTILIYFQLFCILLFSKTFVRGNEVSNEIKIVIKWIHLPGLEHLKKLPDWTERFEISIFGLSYEVEPYFGRAIQPPITQGKIGRYDFATLIVPPKHIGTQNVMEKGKELAESSNRKRKDEDLFELQIKFISPANLNIKQVLIIYIHYF